MRLGPVQKLTLTRAVFVQTSSLLRCFSLETGQEIISPPSPSSSSVNSDDAHSGSGRGSAGMPVAVSSLLKAKKKVFRPLMCALCPLQV
jgi:hypothetical protein